MSAWRQAGSIVDAHLHIWPEPRPQRPYPWTPDPHRLEDLTPVLGESGVSAAIQVTPTIMDFDNEYGFEAAARMPDRIGVFGRIDPARPDIEQALTEFRARPGGLGVRLTFFGTNGEDAQDLSAFDPFWTAAVRTGTPVALLAPGAMGEMVRMLERHPGLRLIVDHLGLGVFEGSEDPFADWSLLPELAPFENVSLKISTLVETSAEPFPFSDVHDHLAEAVEIFGAERLIWASNYPVVLSKCSYEESLAWIGECGFLSDGDRAMLTRGALARFFGKDWEVTS